MDEIYQFIYINPPSSVYAIMCLRHTHARTHTHNNALLTLSTAKMYSLKWKPKANDEKGDENNNVNNRI